MTQPMLIPMFTPMLCDYDQGSPAIKADMAHQSGAGELETPTTPLTQRRVFIISSLIY
jgi:hypothetical protein